MSDHIASARRTDSLSSHITNASISKDVTLSDLIVATAWAYAVRHRLGTRDNPFFTDTQLTDAIERTTGKRQQRNVIARARQLLMDTERHPIENPLILPAGLYEDEDGRLLLHFRHRSVADDGSQQLTLGDAL